MKKKNDIKKIVLFVLLLLPLSMCSTIVMWLLSLIFNVTFDNIIYIGFKVAVFAWLLLLIFEIIKVIKIRTLNNLNYNKKEKQ